ncbi:MerR family transcriptional regulator (plasmid) [Streptomyces sp. NBC_01224]|uniref:MerR family transcriptional regulator n=1 Tax=Streptomyces sp. NBC_01224 TaxID=2903783 RepID=UPI002E0F3B6D|nr:MerR family transcriptional regulator [Streptomyces sp. NBC_01224]
MYPSATPPREVKIGDAAAFAGTTPRAIRHYHQIGLLPEPERGGDGRRRYGYDDMIRLLWIRKMSEAGISLDDMRAAFDEARDVEDVLGRLEETLAAQEADIKRQRAAVQRLRVVGSPLGLLSPLVTDRLSHLPSGALRPSDLDALLVTERIFGPLGAAIQASVFITLATHPGLRAEADRLDAADAALDDTVDPHDPPEAGPARAARRTVRAGCRRHRRDQRGPPTGAERAVGGAGPEAACRAHPGTAGAARHRRPRPGRRAGTRFTSPGVRWPSSVP